MRSMLFAVLLALVPLADSVHADPANVPGLQRNQPGNVNDWFGCPGSLKHIWMVLLSYEDRLEIGKGLDNHFGSSSAAEGAISADEIPEIHERVSKIDSRKHPDAVLRLHAVQHLAEECVLANGENPDPNMDGHLRMAKCEDFNTTRAVMLNCADRAIDAINARHDWNIELQHD